MSRKLFRKSIAWLSIVICFTLFTGSLEGVVFCFGGDGHMELETTPNGIDCAHHPSSPSKEDRCTHVSNDGSSCESGCSSCIDIPLSIDCSLQCSNNIQNQNQSHKGSTAHLPQPACSSIFVIISRPNCLSEVSLSPVFQLSAICSTVLLI